MDIIRRPGIRLRRLMDPRTLVRSLTAVVSSAVGVISLVVLFGLGARAQASS